MSLAFKIYKKQRNIILLLVKKKSDGIMKFTCLKRSFPLFWRSWEASSSSHKQTALSLTPGAGTTKTQAQQVWNITYKTLLLTIIT